MSLFSKRTSVDVRVKVFTKLQKDAFFSIMRDFVEKPRYVFHDNGSITYDIEFLYYANYKAFLFECSGLYSQYKFVYFKI